MMVKTKRMLVGHPLPTVSLGQQLLPKRLALPVFCSDPISSVAYATQEILTQSRTPGHEVDADLAEAFLSASRALVGVAARSLAVGDADITLHRALVSLASRADLADLLGVNSSTATRHCVRQTMPQPSPSPCSRATRLRRRRRRGPRAQLVPRLGHHLDHVTVRLD